MVECLNFMFFYFESKKISPVKVQITNSLYEIHIYSNIYGHEGTNSKLWFSLLKVFSIQPFCHIFVLWQFFPRLSASKNAGAVHNQSVQLRASVAAFFRRMRTDTISFRLTGKFDAETRSFLTKKNPTFRSYFANHFFRLSKPQTERLYVLIHIFYI